MSGQARAVVLGALFLLFPGAPLHADCTTSDDIHLNEIRYADATLPEGGSSRLDAQIELYNKGAVSVPLGGWKITDAQGDTRALLTGSLALPPGAFLEVMLGSGTDDLDFSDGIGTVYTGGDSVARFVRGGDGVALYDGTGVIQDFVSWSSAGGQPSGPAVSDAITAGIWSPSAVVVTTPDAFLFTIRLLPDGFDHDSPSDWVQTGWGISNYSVRTAGPNALQLSPEDGLGLSPGAVSLTWNAVAAAASYHVRVLADPATIELDTTLAATSIPVGLPPGLHRWSVRAVDACGDTGPELFWSFAIFPSSVPGVTGESRARSPGGSRPPAVNDLPGMLVLGVPHFLQHKDTRLLCVSSLNGQGDGPAWPGCAEGAGNQGPWDDAHPADHAEHLDNFKQWIQCAHCAYYCARAANQMINAFYGGNLSQDRLSYQQEELGDRGVPSPEGDLCGHGYSSWWGMAPLVLDWAILNCSMDGAFSKDYPAIRAEILAGYPVRAGYTNGISNVHAVVIDGCFDGILGLIPNYIHVLDPWPTHESGWIEYSKVPLGKWFRIRPAGNNPLVGRLQESSVTTDGDGDGVMDFDEGNSDFAGHGPRKFQSRGDRVDTDGDQVHDKQEIRSYAFHALDHPGHPLPHPSDLNLIGPDPDHDLLRAELDPDSDNDGTFDGGEDLNGNGSSPQAGETCVYYASPSQTSFSADNGSYRPTEPVNLTGVNFHVSSSYTYYVYRGCPLTLGTASPYTGYLSSGSVATDGAGVLQIHLGVFEEGCYTVALDVLQDGLYGDVIAVPGGGTVSEVLDRTASFTVSATSGVTTTVPRVLDLAVAREPDGESVRFAMSLPRAGPTRLALYDVGGKRVRVLFDGWCAAGVITEKWDGRGSAGALSPAGIYYARLTAGARAVSRKVIELR
jgi:hypothetical protein